MKMADMTLAARMAGIAPFHVMELMAKAQALEVMGRSIVHLEVGEPDFPTAAPIIETTQRFLAHGHVHYSNALGLPALREAIAAHYETRHGLHIDPRRIIVTAGASGALLLALGILVSPGDRWLLPDPGYPCNRHFVRTLEGIPVPLPVDASTRYQPTASQVMQSWTPDTRGLMVASPSNPTGSLLSRQELAELWATVKSCGGSMIVDEIYHGLTYGMDADTALAISDDIIVINSFSKYFGMTGWRLGWLVVPNAYLREVEKLAQNLFICASTVAQHAALAAFEPRTIEILESRRHEFEARRNRLIPGLRTLGFKIAAEPVGAFYVYADSSAIADNSFDLASRLLDEVGVAATPGLDFGDHRTQMHMRFSYTTEGSRIEEGLDRMRACLGG